MDLRCSRIAKVYPPGGNGMRALEDVSFTVRAQEFVCIIGPSGCGKTTLLKIIAGLLAPTSGEVTFSNSAESGRPRTALVFQEHGLFPWMSVLENVAFGLEMQGVAQAERHSLARAFIAKVGLTPFADHYPYQLSVGMRQRVGIVRAFVSDPQVLLMDEPFGALDAQTRMVLQDELLRIWKDDRKIVIHVTHDIDEAVRLGDRVFVMTGRPGRIREEIEIPFERPREVASRTPPQVAEIRWHIWKILEEDVRKSLSIPTS
ncbi:MAG: ABC transporter ATP-binding protein [Acidobacteria bacterium]|nr:ABC transporter ATP-binding protein [Acidobacteriota bacterium]